MSAAKLYLSFLILLFLNITQAQDNTILIKNSNIQIGIDYKNNNYIIFDGYDNFYQKPFNSKIWKTVSYKLNQLPQAIGFPYNFFHIKEKNYLVYSGCGEVYEFKNDSIIRIDNSFQHKNQFNSSAFVYNDEIYYFGGYGLFTFKNILTKFDFKTKEWELIKYSNYGKIPQARDHAISFLRNNNFYIIGGYTENYDTDQVSGSGKQLFDIWSLNLKTKSWKYLGDLNDKNIVYAISADYSSYQNKNNFFHDSNCIFKFDFENNLVHYYKQQNKFFLSTLEKYNSESNEIIYAVKNRDDNFKDTKVVVEPFQSYSGKIIKTEKLVSNSGFKYFSFSLLILLIILILYFILKRIKTDKKNCIILSKNTFFYQKKPVNNLTVDEKALLTFFFKNYNKAILMNEVVDFLNKDDNTNYNTLVKKKDHIINGLKQKLVFILDIDEDELFIYKKNNEDKRIKEIQLNPQYFNLKNHLI